MTQTSQTFSTPGTYTYVVPSGIFSLDEVDTRGSGAGGGCGQGSGGAGQTVIFDCTATYSFFGTQLNGNRQNVNGTWYQGTASGGGTGSQFSFAMFNAAAMQAAMAGCVITQVELWAANQGSQQAAGVFLYLGWTTKTDLATDTQITTPLATNTAMHVRDTTQQFYARGEASWKVLSGVDFVASWFLTSSATGLLFGDDATSADDHRGSWSGGPGNVRLRFTFTPNITGGGGGGGGGFGKKTSIPVNPGDGYPVVVPPGGAGSVVGGPVAQDGQDATFGTGGTTPIAFFANTSQIHDMFVQDAAITRTFFDTQYSFGMSGANLIGNPVQDGFAATPVLGYKSYAQFLSDINSGAITYPFKYVQYDPENWSFTPVNEQQDPWTFIPRFISLAHAHGYQAMVAPARDLGNVVGTVHPKLPGESVSDWYLRVNLAAACATADVYQVQNQNNELNLAYYQNFYETTVAQAQAVNPSCVVFNAVSVAGVSGGTGIQAAAAYNTTVNECPGCWVNENGDPVNAVQLLHNIPVPVAPTGAVSVTGHAGTSGGDGDSTGPTGGSHGLGGAADGTGSAGAGGVNGSSTGPGGAGGDAATGGGTGGGTKSTQGAGNAGTGIGSGGGGADGAFNGGKGTDGSVVITWTLLAAHTVASPDFSAGTDTEAISHATAGSPDISAGTEGAIPKIGVRDVWY